MSCGKPPVPPPVPLLLLPPKPPSPNTLPLLFDPMPVLLPLPNWLSRLLPQPAA
jgi:hypothetical protein